MIYQNTYAHGRVLCDHGLLVHHMRSDYEGLLRDADQCIIEGNHELAQRLKAHAGTLLDIMELFNITPKQL